MGGIVQIAFFAPLERGWNRMVTNLFRPFDLKKWFVLGFGVFLAQLTDYHNKYSSSDSDDYAGKGLGEMLEIPYMAWEWLISHPHWSTLIVTGIILIVLITLLFTWLSSGGKLIFLDNVVHERALVKQPWHDFRYLRNSLFMWRFGFGIITILIFGSILVSGYLNIHEMYKNFASDMEMISAALRIGIVFFVLLIIAGYISLFLNDFIVPIMYRNNMTTWIAWSHFIPILRSNLLVFLGYGLFILLLYILVGIVIVIFGFITCCIGFLILTIPYLGSVLTLPISYAFRAFSVEFLQQFGPEFRIFPSQESAAPEPPETTG